MGVINHHRCHDGDHPPSSSWLVLMIGIIIPKIKVVTHVLSSGEVEVEILLVAAICYENVHGKMKADSSVYPVCLAAEECPSDRRVPAP